MIVKPRTITISAKCYSFKFVGASQSAASMTVTTPDLPPEALKHLPPSRPLRRPNWTKPFEPGT